jgi:prepilin-type N-terminal cleavage/methylation domain-containing protein
MSHIERALKHRRGMTLVELMIVVAVIAVLAAIGSMSYTKYVKSAKIGQLEQFAMEVANAQEQYRSHNSKFLGYEDSISYASDEDLFVDILGFSKPNLAEQDITVETESGPSGTGVTCGICEGVGPDDPESMWYAVRVTQDLTTSEDDDTTIIIHSELSRPMRLNEGM